MKQKSDVIRWCIVQGKLKKRLLGFEVTDLQEAVNLRIHTLVPKSDLAFGICDGKKVDPLEIVEFWKVVECRSFDLREDGQAFARVVAHVASRLRVADTRPADAR